MKESEPVLEFTQLAFRDDAPHLGAVQSIDLVLREGELARVRMDDISGGESLADVVQGFAAPVSGEVRFLGRNWCEQSVSQSNTLRGKMGRVSPDYGWVSNLDLEENVALGLRHRTRRPEWEIRAEARRWAQAFGLPDGIPPGRPAGMPADILRRAACVRAFLGEPALIVIVLPRDGGWTALSQPLADACHFLRGRKAAVLWMTDRPDHMDMADLRPTIGLP